MVENLFNVIIKELNKHDIAGSWVLEVIYLMTVFPILRLLKKFNLEEIITVYMCGLIIITKYTTLPICKIKETLIWII